MTQFLYRIQQRQDYAKIAIGIYDPERWKKSLPDEPDRWGDIRFGYDAEVTVRDDFFNESKDTPAYTVEVSQGSIGATSPADGALRADVYRQACAIGKDIELGLSNGESLQDVIDFLALPSKPVDKAVF